MKYPKISIITPTFNCGQYIEEAIDSVLNQDYDNIEYFVIDGGSTDNTLELLKKYSEKYPGKFKWISEPDKGQTDAINKGLRMCTGDWFAWLNADDYYEPNILSKVAEYISKNQDAGVIFGNCYAVKNGKKFQLDIPPKSVTFKTLRGGNQIYGPASFFNMDAIKKVGEFDVDVDYWMDYEMYIRISKIMPLQYINLNIANFRVRPEQKSKTAENASAMHKEAIKIIKTYYNSYYLDRLKMRIKKLPLVISMLKVIRNILLYFKFIGQFFKFKKVSKEHQRFSILWRDLYPRLNDNTTKTSFDRHYVYHTAWAARILADSKPEQHVDISSSLYFNAITSAFIPIKFYDYRPADLMIQGLTSEHADLLALPFKDNSVPSISCMHSIEHIGLGRYGDSIDPNGDIKAISELKRVLKNDGDLLIVVPVGTPKIMYNAHRIYSYEQIIEYFSDLKLNDFTLIPDKAADGGLVKNPSPELLNKQTYGCGCFWFKKTT